MENVTLFLFSFLNQNVPVHFDETIAIGEHKI